MGRPRSEKYGSVDSLILSRAFQEQRSSLEAPTVMIRRIVEECWSGNPDFVAMLSELFPRPSREVLSQAMGGRPVKLDDGTLHFVGDLDSETQRGSWVFVPDMAAIHRMLGISADAATKRIIRRLRREDFKVRGKVIARTPPFLSAPTSPFETQPILDFDSRRGRRREFK
jgi:hypothetical protein